MSEITELEAKIIKQIEYYFSDVNLGRDKFLQEQRKLDDGWISMEIMLKFNRLKQLCDLPENIVVALKKSKTGLIEVSEDGKKIRRSSDKPLPEFTKEVAQELSDRSLYVKGFPKELKLDEGIEFFEKFGVVDQVQMRRHPNKEFKGSCFVVFKEKAGAEKFMVSEGVKYQDNLDLIKLYKEEYFKTKNRSTADQIAKKKQDKKTKAEDAVKSRMVLGSIMVLDGLSKDTKLEAVKEKLGEYGKIQWVDIDEENKQAKVRFSEENEAKTVLEKLGEDGLKFGEQKVKCSVLDGQEEFEHWKGVVNALAQNLNKRKHTGGRKFNKNKKSKRS